MSKKKKNRAPVAAAEGTLKRVMVRISEEDFTAMTQHFAEGKSGLPLVSVHPPSSGKRELTPEARAKRKEYRQRPDVREKMKAYRAKRAARVREALAQLNAAKPA
jgi:hypothetical protein